MAIQKFKRHILLLPLFSPSVIVLHFQVWNTQRIYLKTSKLNSQSKTFLSTYNWKHQSMSTIIKKRYVFKIVYRDICIYLWTSCWHNSLVSCRVRCAASIILYCIMKREINFWKLDSIFCNLFAILLIFSICGSGHFYFLSVNYVHCTKLPPPPLPESNLNPDVHVLPFVRMKINKTYLHHSFTLLYYLKNIPCLHTNSFWMSSA